MFEDNLESPSVTSVRRWAQNVASCGDFRKAYGHIKCVKSFVLITFSCDTKDLPPVTKKYFYSMLGQIIYSNFTRGFFIWPGWHLAALDKPWETCLMFAIHSLKWPGFFWFIGCGMLQSRSNEKPSGKVWAYDCANIPQKYFLVTGGRSCVSHAIVCQIAVFIPFIFPHFL